MKYIAGVVRAQPRDPVPGREAGGLVPQQGGHHQGPAAAGGVHCHIYCLQV